MMSFLLVLFLINLWYSDDVMESIEKLLRVNLVEWWRFRVCENHAICSVDVIVVLFFSLFSRGFDMETGVDACDELKRWDDLHSLIW